MAFVLVPTRFLGPIAQIEGQPQLLAGFGDDDGLLAYPSTESDSGTVWVLSEQISYNVVLTVGSTPYPLARQPGSVFGLPWFLGDYLLYWTAAYGWVALAASASRPAGYIPQEWEDSDSVWQGDAFFRLASGGPEGTYASRGTYRNDVSPPTASAERNWPRWSKSGPSPLGEYAAVAGSGVTGTRSIGLPKWTGSDGLDYWRSPDMIFGHYTYGDNARLHWEEDALAYVIGEVGSSTGWWQGALAPDVSTPRTYAFTQNPGGELVEADIVLTYELVGYGPGSTLRWIGEVGICR
jgi:hypothetical protein